MNNNNFKKLIVIGFCIVISVVSLAMQAKGCIDKKSNKTETSSEAESGRTEAAATTEDVSQSVTSEAAASTPEEITTAAQSQPVFNEDNVFSEDVEEDDNYYIYFTNTVDEIDVPGFLPKEAHMKLIRCTQHYLEANNITGITELKVVSGSCQGSNEKAVFICYSPQTGVSVTVTYGYDTGEYSYSHSAGSGGGE